MKYKRDQYKLLLSMQQRMENIYTEAYKRKEPHSWICGRLESFWRLANSEEVGARPATLDKLHWIGKTLFDMAERTWLEWRVFYKGQHVTSDKVPAGEWDKVESSKGQHFYIGTDKPYH